MTEGLVFFVLLGVVAVLLIVGFVGCAARSREEERRHDHSEPNQHIPRS